MLPAMTTAAHAHGLPRALPAPKPIPGGIDFRRDGYSRLRPSTAGHHAAFTGIQLIGRDVEPSVITDYTGVTGLAFHVGTATGSDGRRYNLETDMRAMEGTSIAEDRLAAARPVRLI
jgi:hypothetical protein